MRARLLGLSWVLVPGVLQVAAAQPDGFDDRPARPAPEVHVADEASCIEAPHDLEAQILDALNAVEDGPLPLEVEIAVENASASGSTVRVLLTGRLGADIVLARTYDTLKRADCAGVPLLLLAAVRRFVDGFPVEQWRRPPPPTPTPTPTLPPPPPPRYHLVAVAGSTLGVTTRAEAEASFVRVAPQGRLPILVSGTFRAGWPTPLGDGQYQMTALLLGVGWHQELGPWIGEAEVRGGGALLAGSGFGSNALAAGPWIEGSGRAGRRFGPWLLGAQASYAPLTGRVAVHGTEETQQLAQFRAGVFLSWQLP